MIRSGSKNGRRRIRARGLEDKEKWAKAVRRRVSSHQLTKSHPLKSPKDSILMRPEYENIGSRVRPLRRDVSVGHPHLLTNRTYTC